MPSDNVHAHARPTVVNAEDLDTDLLLCLLSEVEEQIAESRACVHQASSKMEEGKEFEAAAAERAKEAQLSEATRRKLQRRAQVINAEVKSEVAKAIAQLRHAAHHYKHTRGEIERALRQRDRKLASNSSAEGRAEALAKTAEDAKDMIKELQSAKEGAEVRAQSLQQRVQELERAKHAAETQGRTLSGAISEHEAALGAHVEEAAAREKQIAQLNNQVSELEAALHAESEEARALKKVRDNLHLQLANSKDVVARITADNLMFLNKIKHYEGKLEQAVREREVLRADLNANDNRWFEHLRDELYKVTQSHLKAIDDYQSKLQAQGDEAEEREATLQEASDDMMTWQELSRVREEQEATQAQLAAKTAAHDHLAQQLEKTSGEMSALCGKHEALASAHGAAQANSDTRQARLAQAESDLAARDGTIAELQRRLQEAGKSVAEAMGRAEQREGESQSLRDDLQRHKATNEILLREKHEVERKALAAQAEADLQTQKLAAAEAGLAAARQEKDVLSRQLALTSSLTPMATPAR